MIALIDRTYTARKPNGETTRVNIADFNLAYYAYKLVGNDSYIQCSDTGWIKVSNLTIVDWEIK